MDEGEGLRALIQLFAYLPKEKYESILLDQELILSQKLTKEGVDYYLNTCQTKICTLMMLGYQKLSEGITEQDLKKVEYELKEIVGEGSIMTQKLESIFLKNNIGESK